jgi:uridylate kinase
VRIAKTHGVKTVINLSNIDYVYDRDPKKNKNAEKLPKLRWKEFRLMFGKSWNPGANVPFDPVAAKLAEKERIAVVVMNGNNLPNLKKFFSGKHFAGTVID